MIRRVPNVYIKDWGTSDTVTLMTGSSPGRKYGGPLVQGVPREAYTQMQEDPTTPVPFAGNGRAYWAYRGEFYVTTESLTPNDVRALLAESDNRKWP